MVKQLNKQDLLKKVFDMMNRYGNPENPMWNPTFEDIEEAMNRGYRKPARIRDFLFATMGNNGIGR